MMMMKMPTSSFSLTSVLPPPSFVDARSSWLDARLSPPFSPGHDDFDDCNGYNHDDDDDDDDDYDVSYCLFTFVCLFSCLPFLLSPANVFPHYHTVQCFAQRIMFILG